MKRILACIGLIFLFTVSTVVGQQNIAKSAVIALKPVPAGRLLKGEIPCGPFGVAYEQSGRWMMGIFPKDADFIRVGLGSLGLVPNKGPINIVQDKISFPVAVIKHMQSFAYEQDYAVEILVPEVGPLQVRIWGFSTYELMSCRVLKEK